jgi:hypothetical protein
MAVRRMHLCNFLAVISAFLWAPSIFSGLHVHGFYTGMGSHVQTRDFIGGWAFQQSSIRQNILDARVALTKIA